MTEAWKCLRNVLVFVHLNQIKSKSYSHSMYPVTTLFPTHCHFDKKYYGFLTQINIVLVKPVSSEYSIFAWIYNLIPYFILLSESKKRNLQLHWYLHACAHESERQRDCVNTAVECVGHFPTFLSVSFISLYVIWFNICNIMELQKKTLIVI